MTQGLVIVLKDGKVIAKIIAGCCGMNAKRLAQSIKENRPWPDELYTRAVQYDFGCSACLVVMCRGEATRIKTLQHSEQIESGTFEADYWATFDDPKWNPRWKRGTAPYVEVVEL
jgi:hypothetical protein